MTRIIRKKILAKLAASQLQAQQQQAQQYALNEGLVLHLNPTRDTICFCYSSKIRTRLANRSK